MGTFNNRYLDQLWHLALYKIQPILRTSIIQQIVTAVNFVLKNQEFYFDEQENILDEQPSSQPAGYDPRDFFSQPTGPSLIPATEDTIIERNEPSGVFPLPQVLAYETAVSTTDT